MRPLFHFFALGAALFVAKGAMQRLLPDERAPIEVVVPAEVGRAELAQRVDEAILVEEGLRFGWAESDPVIRRRLALSMAFARGEALPTSDAAVDERAIEEAFALGMHRSDPVVRGRLASRVQQLLEKPDPAELPDDATLRAHMEAHRARFERPSRLAFVHLAFARDRRGETVATDAEALLARLRRGEVELEAAASLSDRSPLLARAQRASVSAIDRFFGDGFGAAVASLEVGAWSGPIASSYGVHLVRVDAREGARLPPLEAVRARVLADYLATTRPRRVARRLDELRARYSVRVVRSAEPRSEAPGASAGGAS